MLTILKVDQNADKQITWGGRHAFGERSNSNYRFGALWWVKNVFFYLSFQFLFLNFCLWQIKIYKSTRNHVVFNVNWAVSSEQWTLKCISWKCFNDFLHISIVIILFLFNSNSFIWKSTVSPEIWSKLICRFISCFLWFKFLWHFYFISQNWSAFKFECNPIAFSFIDSFKFGNQTMRLWKSRHTVDIVRVRIAHKSQLNDNVQFYYIKSELRIKLYVQMLHSSNWDQCIRTLVVNDRTIIIFYSKSSVKFQW